MPTPVFVDEFFSCNFVRVMTRDTVIIVVDDKLPHFHIDFEDIVPLAYHLIQHAENGPTGKRVRFRSKVKQAMENYDWPGNGKELRYFTESLLFRTNKALIDYSDLPKHIKKNSELSHHDKGTSLCDYFKKAEKNAIQEALAEAD